MDSCYFWIISTGILYHSSSSCLRDYGVICFSPSSLEQTTVVWWNLRWAIVLARGYVEVHLHAPQTKTKHFWLCMGKLTSWKTASFLQNKIWTTECTRLPKMSTQSLTVIRPFRVSTGLAEYYKLLSKSSEIWLHVSQLGPAIQGYRLPWVMSKHKPALMLGTTWRMTYLTILSISNHRMASFFNDHTILFNF